MPTGRDTCTISLDTTTDVSSSRTYAACFGVCNAAIKCAGSMLSEAWRAAGGAWRTAESVYRTPLRSSNSSSSQVPSPARPSPRHAPCWIVSLLVARSDSSRNDLRRVYQ